MAYQPPSAPYQPQGYNPYQQSQPGWNMQAPEQRMCLRIFLYHTIWKYSILAPVYGGDPHTAEGGIPKVWYYCCKGYILGFILIKLNLEFSIYKI